MILVATTLAAFAMEDPAVWGSWLATAQQLKESYPEGVTFFAAIEVDARGIEPFGPLFEALEAVGGEHWTFTLDDGRTSVTTGNRLRHITMGQNLCVDRASAPGVTHLLFLAADCQPPADAIPKLLEVGWPLVGGEVSTYCLSGPEVPGYAFPVQRHMATAAFVLIERDVFKRLRWRWDAEAGMSDDPCYHADAIELLGVQTRVRKDCVGRHFPEAIGAIEGRGHDLRVVRREA